MRRALAIVATLCFAIALVELVEATARHDPFSWIAGGLLALAVRAALEGSAIE